MSVLLSRRALLTAAVETTYGTPPAMTGADAFLISDPVFSVDPTVLERNFVRDDLSPMAHTMGRKIARMTFSTELRGNGLQQSGIAGDAPKIARLLRGCGYAMTAFAAASVVAPKAIGDHANPVSWATGGTITATEPIAYYVAVTTGGASGVAEITITSDVAGEGVAEAVITTGTPVDLGTKGAEITPTFTGDLVVGQRWIVWVLPKGIKFDPVSDDFESVAFRMYLDGTLHSMPGALGTFDITAEAGQFASINWDFMGIFVQPTDTTMISGTFETALPPQVELARLRIDDFNAIVAAFSYDQANDIQIRPDVSSSDGYIGTRIVGRNPSGGIDPEADLVASHDFWGRLADAQRMPFHMRIGQSIGNTVYIMAPNVQYTGLTYQDRNGIRAYDAGLKFARQAGNDEISFFFC